VLAPETLLALINHFKGSQVISEFPAMSRTTVKHAFA
jgi:hypothetical protein